MSEKIALRAGAKVAEKASVKVASKTVANTSGKLAVKAIPIIGWGITAGIVIWDVLDYQVNATKGKEILRENISEYLKEVKTELLSDSEGNIMGAITYWENSLKERIAKR
ncbi:MAG: hypothetical protein K6E51_13400 [Treponema sp.]|nr:hypothetical protein [Treponema sp.]